MGEMSCIPIPSLGTNVWEWMGMHDAVALAWNPLRRNLQITRDPGCSRPTKGNSTQFDYRVTKDLSPVEYQEVCAELCALVDNYLWVAVKAKWVNPWWLYYEGRSPLELRRQARDVRDRKLSEMDFGGVRHAKLLEGYLTWHEAREKRLSETAR